YCGGRRVGACAATQPARTSTSIGESTSAHPPSYRCSYAEPIDPAIDLGLSRCLDGWALQSYITNQSVINPMSLTKLISAPPDEVQAKRERRKEARPGELLDAALDLFVEKGFAATRAEEVAARAGVSKGTLFLYFPSKEELFKAVVRENISGRFQEWNQEFETFDGNSADMLRYCMKVWWDRIGASRASGITKLMISEARNFPELAAFYQQEVIVPANRIIRR